MGARIRALLERMLAVVDEDPAFNGDMRAVAQALEEAERRLAPHSRSGQTIRVSGDDPSGKRPYYVQGPVLLGHNPGIHPAVESILSHHQGDEGAADDPHDDEHDEGFDKCESTFVHGSSSGYRIDHGQSRLGGEPYGPAGTGRGS